MLPAGSSSGQKTTWSQVTSGAARLSEDPLAASRLANGWSRRIKAVSQQMKQPLRIFNFEIPVSWRRYVPAREIRSTYVWLAQCHYKEEPSLGCRTTHSVEPRHRQGCGGPGTSLRVPAGSASDATLCLTAHLVSSIYYFLPALPLPLERQTTTIPSLRSRSQAAVGGAALPATGGARGLRATPSGTPGVDHFSCLIPDHFSRLLTDARGAGQTHQHRAVLRPGAALLPPSAAAAGRLDRHDLAGRPHLRRQHRRRPHRAARRAPRPRPLPQARPRPGLGGPPRALRNALLPWLTRNVMHAHDQWRNTACLERERTLGAALVPQRCYPTSPARGWHG